MRGDLIAPDCPAGARIRRHHHGDTMSSSTTDRVQRRVQRQIAFHLQRADVLESCLETPGLLAATIHRTAAQELQEVLHDITDLLAELS